ncbi:MAG: polyprenyl synthetase family protein [Gammaproteobacteria bacterium]
MTDQAFHDRVPGYLRRLQDGLDRHLPAADAHPARLHAAMRYACDGGKRLRGLLVYASAEALALLPAQVDAAACAVELIHAYSLVHDDLPAMDDDALRRGRATTHMAFDEATAILAGDALGTLAFGVLAGPGSPLDAVRQIQQLQLLARAAGSLGMVGGQALDLAAEGRPLALAELEDLHQRKTGALIEACVHMPLLAAAPAAATRQALERYAASIGLAYQVQDDVLDVQGSSAVLGKTAGKDQLSGKATYVSALGLDGARAQAARLFEAARQALAAVPRAEPLHWMCDFIQGREH